MSAIDAAFRLPAGMRNNNPGNMKFSPALSYAGIVGPSQNTDQGDPQVVFDTPENGMSAMYQLLRRKYNGGKITPNQIIAGQGGWTPGNSQAAANVARTAGIGPDDNINFNDPTSAASFMRGLLLQEHGPASNAYTDEMIRAAISGEPAMAAGTPHQAGSYPVYDAYKDPSYTSPGQAAPQQPAPGTPQAAPGVNPAVASLPQYEGGSMWSKLMSGGPGAFLGAPQAGWNMGDALGGAAASLMAINNPAGANAMVGALHAEQAPDLLAARLQAQAAAGQRKDDANSVQQAFPDPKTGRVTLLYRDGRTETRQLYDPPAKQLSDHGYQLLTGYNDKASQAFDTAKQANEFRDMFVRGDLSVDALRRVAGSADQYLNSSDAKERNAALFTQWLHKAVNTSLLDAKGVQTEGDAQRALEGLMPGASQYDDATAATLLGNAVKGFRSTYDRNSKYVTDMLRDNPGSDDGSYGQGFADQRRTLDGFETDYGPRYDTWLKSRQAAPAPASGAPVTGRSPVQTPQPAAQPAPSAQKPSFGTWLRKKTQQQMDSESAD